MTAQLDFSAALLIVAEKLVNDPVLAAVLFKVTGKVMLRRQVTLKMDDAFSFSPLETLNFTVAELKIVVPPALKYPA